MLEKPKNTNAKRQAEYRKRHLKDGSDQRLNVILDVMAKQALERMARQAGVTNKELLERVLLAAQDQLLAQMDDEQSVIYFAPVGKASSKSS